MGLLSSGRLAPRLVIGLALYLVPISHAVLGEEQNSSGLQVSKSGLKAQSAGVYTYVPGKWGILSVEVTNNGDKPQEVLTTSYFEGNPTLQYGRRFRLPEKSRLRTWHPALVPEVPPGGPGRLTVNSLVLDPTADSEVLIRENTGEMLHSGMIPLFSDPIVTALIDSRGNAIGEPPNSIAYDLVVASRVGNRLSRITSQMRETLFAPDEASLQAVHQLVIADSRVLDDPAGVASVRRWVHGGGKLWVMLDRVDPLALELILGDTFDCQVVDRVGLNTVRIESSGRVGGVEAVESEYEVPVDLVRTIVGGVEEAYLVNGWPAAFWKTFGQGKVLVTTLGAQAWMRPKTSADQQSEDTRFQSAWVPLAPMRELARDFYLPRPKTEAVSQTLESQVGEYVGYTIPSRRVIIGLLAGCGGLIVACGVWLLKRRSLEHLGWIGPLASMCAALALLGIGTASRHVVPATAASLEFVQAVPGSDDIRTRGAMALFSPEEAASQISATRGGWLIPNMQGLESTVRRMVWTDLDQWHWEHLSLRAGQRLASFSESSSSPQRMEARGAFGLDGLSGTVSAAGATGLGDALIATRDGRIGATLSEDGAFHARAADVLASDQFLLSRMINDEQDRRARTYEQVLHNLHGSEGGGEPLLFVWSNPWDAGFRVDESRRRVGSSLMAIPLVLERSPPGTEVRIPAPFLPFRNTLQPDGTPSSPLWNFRSQEWQERAEPSSVWLRFHVPRELLPIALTRGLFIVDVTGPVGRFELLGLKHAAEGDRGEPVSIETRRDPVGRLTFEISDPAVLAVEPEGGLVLGFNAGDPQRPELTRPPDQDGKISYWRIENLSLELWGRTGKTTNAE